VPDAWGSSGGGASAGPPRRGRGNNDNDEDEEAALASASDNDDEDVFVRHPPLVDLDASAPDWEDRCSALRRLMPRGLSSARVRLPGRAAVAAGAPSAPRVLAALLFALRGQRRSGPGGSGSGGEQHGGLQHLTLHLDEDGVELFDEEEEEEGQEATTATRPALPSNDSSDNTSSASAPPPLPPHLGSLRSLAVTGGALSRRSTTRLLRALAAACPRLEALRLLPDRSVAAPGAGGVSDADVPLLAALAVAAPLLATLEFSAASASSSSSPLDEEEAGGGGGGLPPGFTGAGLVALARALPSLRVLRVHRLDALAATAAADAQCFAERPSLRELHLGCDAVLPAHAARRLAAAAGGLSMRFRWSEPPLLRTATVGLAGTLLRLDLGVVRLPDGDQRAAGRFVASLSALTRLQALRCALTAGPMEGDGGSAGQQEDDEQQEDHDDDESGSDEDGSSAARRRRGARSGGIVTLPLSQLASLTDLRALEITKRAAFSSGGAATAAPPRAAFVEPSLSIPLSPQGAARLATSCARLRSLRLRLSRRDVSAEGLAALAQFSRLERLSLVVDYNSGGGGGGGGSGGGGVGGLSSSPPAALSLLSSSPSSLSSSPSFLHATSLVSLDLLDLPPTLTALHLRHVSVSTPASALEALAARGGSGGSGDDDNGDDPSAQALPPMMPPPSSSRSLHLADVDLEQCRVRPAQLAALVLAAAPTLRRLRLSGVAGLTDDAVASLGTATGLRELSIEAPGNKNVTQRGLLALGAPLAQPLRRLTWRSDDLSRLGPCLSAYAAFTALRGLSLSCTKAAAERGAKLRRANEAAGGGGGGVAAAPSSCAAQQQQQWAGWWDSHQSPVDALRALLPLATLEFAGASPIPALVAAGGQQQLQQEDAGAATAPAPSSGGGG
jgi:hypothetical protein